MKKLILLTLTLTISLTTFAQSQKTILPINNPVVAKYYIHAKDSLSAALIRIGSDTATTKRELRDIANALLEIINNIDVVNPDSSWNKIKTGIDNDSITIDSLLKQYHNGILVIQTYPDGGLKTSGGRIAKIKTVTDTYNVLSDDYTVICNKSTSFTVTLPVAVIGQIFNIKNINIGEITLDANSTDTIDGDLTITLLQWDSVTIQCYEANKWIIL
jgi:hypothetical protein